MVQAVARCKGHFSAVALLVGGLWRTAFLASAHVEGAAGHDAGRGQRDCRDCFALGHSCLMGLDTLNHSIKPGPRRL